jgi:hypothetical protein
MDIYMQDHNDNITNENSKLVKNNKIIVHIFGDSHVVIFVGISSQHFRTNVAGYDGASIFGLNRMLSRLEYGKHVLNIMKHTPNTNYALLKLGQVDLEFVMYHKVYVKRKVFTFNEFCDKLIKKYRKFINKVLEINKNVIIASINLPSYRDDVDIRGYIKRVITTGPTLNNDVIVVDSIDMNDQYGLDKCLCDFSLEQLTKNFMYFNELLCSLAKEMNLRFFDTTKFFMDNDTKLLKNEYRDYGHHYGGYYDSDQFGTKGIFDSYFNLFFENEDMK